MKGVIFDLDGVLVSTDELHFEAWRYLADKLEISNFTREDNLRQRGVSRMESLEILLEKSERNYSEEEKKDLAEAKNAYYVHLLDGLTSSDALPGAFETLDRMRELGIMTAVGSASKNAPLILEKTGLLKHVDKVSCGLDVHRSKPDPEVFLVAAGKLGIEPGDCLVVEDAAAGIEAARRGGMRTLGVGPMHDMIGADYSADTLAEVTNWEEILWDRK